MKNLILSVTLALSSVIAPIAAQAHGMPGVDHREQNQQERIAAGMTRGQITPREGVRLERGQEHVRQMERRAERDGVVSRREAARIHHAQDVQSHRIWVARHNRFGR